jgi:penicillin amidase
VLVENTFRDEVGDDLFQRYFAGIGMEDFLKTQSSWFDDVTTPQIETRDDIVAKSFEQAVANLSAKLGPDPDTWEWAKVNQVMINHRTPLSKVAPYDKILNLGPYGKRGRADWTINPVNNDIYEQIVDLSNIDNSISMMPPGNSGHVDSAHYSDQVDLWMKGDYHPSFLSIERARDAAVEHRLYVPR